MFLFFATVIPAYGCDSSRIQSDSENLEVTALIAKDMARRAEYSLPMPVERFFSEDVSVQGPFSLMEIEVRSLQEIEKSKDVPQNPFGFQNHCWRIFRININNQDQLFEYNTYRDSGSLAAGFGASGVVAVRSGQVVMVFPTSLY